MIYQKIWALLEIIFLVAFLYTDFSDILCLQNGSTYAYKEDYIFLGLG